MFPLSAGHKNNGKQPMIAWGDGASADPDVIDGMPWGRGATGYGIVMGEGLSAVDVDKLDLAETHLLATGPWADTLTVQTPRPGGGFHLVYRCDPAEGRTQGGWQDPEDPDRDYGIDIRGSKADGTRGGFIVGPGSWSPCYKRLWEIVDDRPPAADGGAVRRLYEHLNRLWGVEAKPPRPPRPPASPGGGGTLADAMLAHRPTAGWLDEWAGGWGHRAEGGEWLRGHCPRCRHIDEKANPGLQVNATTGGWKCWQSDQHGGLPDLAVHLGVHADIDTAYTSIREAIGDTGGVYRKAVLMSAKEATETAEAWGEWGKSTIDNPAVSAVKELPRGGRLLLFVKDAPAEWKLGDTRLVASSGRDGIKVNTVTVLMLADGEAVCGYTNRLPADSTLVQLLGLVPPGGKDV